MAKHLVAFELEGGDAIWVEVDDAGLGADYVRATKDVTEKAAQTFNSALTIIRTTGAKVLDQVESLQRENARLSTVEVAFGVKLVGKLGAVLASTEAEATFQVKLTWTPVDSTPG